MVQPPPAPSNQRNILYAPVVEFRQSEFGIGVVLFPRISPDLPLLKPIENTHVGERVHVTEYQLRLNTPGKGGLHTGVGGHDEGALQHHSPRRGPRRLPAGENHPPLRIDSAHRLLA